MDFLQRNLFVKLRSDHFHTKEEDGTDDYLQAEEDSPDDEEPQRCACR